MTTWVSSQLLTHPQLLWLAMLRPLGLCVMFPLLGSRSLGSALLRNALILAFTLPLLPPWLHQYAPTIGARADAAFIFQEILIGVLIGFVAALPFWALDSAGFIIDTLRGSSMASVLNPSLGEAASIFGILFVQAFIALFFLQGGLEQVLSVLYRSYQIIPPGTPLRFSRHWLTLLLSQWHMLFTLCLSFALPAIIAMVLTDLAIGLINRSAQQLNVFFLAMPIKSFMVLLILLACLPFAFQPYFDYLTRFSTTLSGLLQAMRDE
ncbi:type III secretion system protein SsaT [Serratia quinivorans]|nr:type III secretion system protein SsaT [Serratia quinivorans]CAI1808763.1 type III secretion system protein SsaT [Serratia quinivorans]